MTLPTSQGRVELRQSRANVLQGPILIAVVVLAAILRVAFTRQPSIAILSVLAVAMALDIVLAVYCLRTVVATLVVTPDDITFTGRHRRGKALPTPHVIQRAAGTVLSFRMAANGPVGADHTGYVLKLRDNATGKEVFAGSFGRRKVQQACELQGWSFS